MVSVIITCYNYGKYLPECIQSVLNQTYKNVEIVIVNDGSTDNTNDIMLPYLANNSVKYISQDNRGQANAKNVGIANSTGEYIAFLDADDLWLPDKLEKQLQCICNDTIGVVYCRANYFDEDSNELNYEMTSEYLQPQKGKVTEYLIFDNFIQFSSTIVKRECFKKFGCFDETLKMGIDWDLWLRMSTYYHFDYVNERLFYYRMGHSGQMSKNMDERHRCSDRIIEKFLVTYPNTVSNDLLKQSISYTRCNRGEYFRKFDMIKSMKFFIDAIKANPFDMRAYKGIAKNILYKLGLYSS